MALTITTPVVRRDVFGTERIVIADITFDNSYVTGGLSFKPSDIGLRIIDFADLEIPTSGKTASFDRTNNKLLLFSGAAEVTNASDQSAVKVRIKAVGK